MRVPLSRGLFLLCLVASTACLDPRTAAWEAGGVPPW